MFSRSRFRLARKFLNKEIFHIEPESREHFQAELRASSSVKGWQALDERGFEVQLEGEFRPLFALHRFPVQQELTLSDARFETVAQAPYSLPWQALQGRRFAIQLSANRRLDWSFAELARFWGESLPLHQEGRDNRRPEWVLSCHIHTSQDGCRVFCGISPVVDNLSPWSRGICRIPRDSASVSRAESKLEEALELLTLAGCGPDTDGSALDLGAAPGGWTRVLAARGLKVTAVDPAELHPSVAAQNEVTHHKTTAGEFLRNCLERFTLVVSDMKMEASMVSSLMVDLVGLLRPGAPIIVTLKLPKGKSALSVCQGAVAEIERAYTLVQARQLYFNRNEVTVIATAPR